jgi:hypothetical protein
VTRRKVVAMLIYTLGQIRGYTDVRRAIESARKDIDAGLFFFSHSQRFTAKWTLKQVQGDGVLKNQRHHQNQRHPEFISGPIGKRGKIWQLALKEVSR